MFSSLFAFSKGEGGAERASRPAEADCAMALFVTMRRSPEEGEEAGVELIVIVIAMEEEEDDAEDPELVVKGADVRLAPSKASSWIKGDEEGAREIWRKY